MSNLSVNNASAGGQRKASRQAGNQTLQLLAHQNLSNCFCPLFSQAAIASKDNGNFPEGILRLVWSR